MSKTVFKSVMVLVIVSMLSIGSAFAMNPLARDDSGRVTVAQNGYGDVLLGQIYQTREGYQTRIKIVNSSDSMAVVARIIFRSAVYCVDVFDFNLYLTPTDAWEGVVSMSANGNAQIYSVDDSVMSSNRFKWDGTAACNPFDGQWANELDENGAPLALNEEFFTVGLKGGDTNQFGHFEVVGIHAFPATAPLSKDTLAMASHVTNEIVGLNPVVPVANLMACDYNLDGAATDVPNILTGTVRLEQSQSAEAGSVNLIALKNWENKALTGFSTILAPPLSATTFNGVAEIEAALAKESYSFPFNFNEDQDIQIVNTLPTRYLADKGLSSFPGLINGICHVEYDVYDMEETLLLEYLSGDSYLNCLPEVSWQKISNVGLVTDALADGYLEGWINVIFDGGRGGYGLSATGLNGMAGMDFMTYAESGMGYTAAGSNVQSYQLGVGYSGLPSINSTILFDSEGQMMWKYASSPESDVYYYEDANQDGVMAVTEDVNESGVLGTYKVRQ